jgi:hypothetical protein
LAWAAAVVPAAPAGQVLEGAEQVRVAQACGNPAECRAEVVAAEERAAAQAEERELALAQAPEVAEVQVVAEEPVVRVESEAGELAPEALAVGRVLVAERALAAERGQALGRKSQANG